MIEIAFITCYLIFLFELIHKIRTSYDAIFLNTIEDYIIKYASLEGESPQGFLNSQIPKLIN